jgi:hypothetical protein
VPALHSAGQPARYSSAPSTTRPFSHSPSHRNPLNDDLTHSLLLLPTVIRSNFSPLPTFPATFSDRVPFLCAGCLAPVFTALLVLLAEDDSNDNKVLSEQQSQLTSYQRRFVGLREKERERTICSQSSYYGSSPFQRNVKSSPASGIATAQRSHHQCPVFQTVIWCVSFALGPYPSVLLDRPSR